MRRFGLRAAGGYMLYFSAVVATAVLVLPSLDILPPAPAAALGLVVALVGMLTIHGKTLVEWWGVRRRMRTRLTPAVVAASDGAAVALSPASTGRDPQARNGVIGTGSDEASVWLEITPANPFHLATVNGAETTHPQLDLEELAPLMSQGGDLLLQRLEVVVSGMRIAQPTSTGRMVSTLPGPLPTHLSGRTFLKATLRLDDAYPAIRARAIDGDMAVGTHRAALSAVARIRVKIEGMGLAVRILTPEQCRQISASVLMLSGDGLDDAHWRQLGGRDGMRASVSLTPRVGKVTPELQDDWVNLPASQVVEVSRLERVDRGQIHHGYWITYGSDSEEVTKVPPALKLRPLFGQQAQAVSQIIPVSAAENLDIPLSPLGGDVPAVFAGGVGLFVGKARSGKAFLHMAAGTGATLHIAGSDALAQQMILRLVSQPMTVDIRIGDPVPGTPSVWPEFVRRLGRSMVTYKGNDDADIVVVAPGGERRLRPDQTVIVVSSQSPSKKVAASIVQSGATELVVTSGRDQMVVDATPRQSELEHIVTPQAARLATTQ